MRLRYPRMRQRAGVIPLAFTLALGCTDSTGPAYVPPTPQPRPRQTPAPAIGTFHVVISTAGLDLDPDGYVLTVDDTVQFPVRSNDTVVVTNVVLDRHTLRLGNIAANCVPDTVSGRSLQLTSARDTVTRFAIECLASVVPPDLAGMQLLFVRGGVIYRATLGGAAVPAGLAVGDEPVWSPDGQRIVLVRRGDTYVIDAYGANERLIANGPDFPVGANGPPSGDGWDVTYIDGGRHAAAWSPDGTRLALYSDSMIVIAPVDGATAPVFLGGHQASTIDVIVGSPTWSPDGKHIAFVGDSWGEPLDLFVGDVDGAGLSNVRRLTNGLAAGTLYLQPAWSPDGKRIALVACAQAEDDWKNPCADSRIVVMNADGSQPRTLAYARGYSRPSWAPDGQAVIFANTCWDYRCPSAVLYVSVDGTHEGVLMDDAHSPSLRR